MINHELQNQHLKCHSQIPDLSLSALTTLFDGCIMLANFLAASTYFQKLMINSWLSATLIKLNLLSRYSLCSNYPRDINVMMVGWLQLPQMKEADKIDCLQFVALYNFQQWLDHHLDVSNELKTHHWGGCWTLFRWALDNSPGSVVNWKLND